MSIVRIGLSERSNAAEGYEAIFGKKKGKKPEPAKAEKGGDAKKKKAKKK